MRPDIDVIDETDHGQRIGRNQSASKGSIIARCPDCQAEPNRSRPSATVSDLHGQRQRVRNRYRSVAARCYQQLVDNLRFQKPSDSNNGLV